MVCVVRRVQTKHVYIILYTHVTHIKLKSNCLTRLKVKATVPLGVLEDILDKLAFESMTLLPCPPRKTNVESGFARLPPKSWTVSRLESAEAMGLTAPQQTTISSTG